MDPQRLAKQIQAWAKELGFADVGFADVDLSAYAPKFREWLAQRFHGEMGYLERNLDKRFVPAALEPATVCVISVRMDYLGESPPSATDLPENDGSAYVAQYARGRDYHKTVRRRLARLARKIDSEAPGHYRAFTDSAPVLEKPLGEKAGLGWIGKNTLLLTEEAGSWFFLGEIYTDLPLPPSPPKQHAGCGNCRACISVCPTDAIVAPGVLDARRCIAYLTIESHDPIPLEFREAIGNRIFGCDDCQIVCPWNRFATKSEAPDFAPRHGLDCASIADLLHWTKADFARRTEGMALRRINYQQWLRNLAVAAGNAPQDPTIIELLHDRRPDAEPIAREHIDWALTRQTQR